MTGIDRHLAAAASMSGGQISLAESRFLGELVSNLSSPGPIVEIGTLFAWSTRIISLFKSASRELITVDNYSWNPLNLSPDLHYKTTYQILAEAIRNHNVKLVRQDKSSFYKCWNGKAPSLVFLDAIHTYQETSADIAWAKTVGAHVICLHDYSPVFPGVIQAVNESGGVQRQVESLVVLR